ncbi:hypothetical protein ACWDNI_17495 [Nocardia niigatensis]
MALLLDRFQKMALATSTEELRRRSSGVSRGLEELPVALRA